jgi:hypothetical protein
MKKMFTLISVLFLCGNAFSADTPPAQANPKEYYQNCKGAVRAAYSRYLANDAVNALNHKLQKYPDIPKARFPAEETGAEQQITGYADIKTKANRSSSNWIVFYKERLYGWIDFCNKINW